MVSTWDGGGAMFGARPMHRLLILLLILAAVTPAGAHLGNENNTEVRVYADKLRVVLRTSIPFAWKVLGEGAPALADEAGQAIAKPLLIAAAPDLIRVTAGGKPLTPTQVDCMFEVGNDVAFVLNFERPVEWPVVVMARFFERFSSLDTGTITVFDYTASRFTRDPEPIAQQVIDARSPSLSFTLGAAVAAAPPQPEVALPTPVAATTADAGGSGKWIAGLILLVAVGTVGWLTRRRLRRES